MKKWILGLMVLAALAGGILMRSQESRPTVAILQTASHPALDLVRDEFVAAFQKEMGDAWTIQLQNAEGSLSQAHAIAQQLHSDEAVKLILTIGSPATQMMAQIEKKKPLLFAAVSDPKALGILETNKNISGSCDTVDAEATAQLLVDLAPHARTVALLFTPAEINASAMVPQLKAALGKRGLVTIEVGIHQESDVATAAAQAARRGDAILCPIDNTVASAIEQIVRVTQEVPLFVCDNLLVKKGAFAACGIDYAASGRGAAAMAVRVLRDGLHPAELPIQNSAAGQICINEDLR